MGKSTISMAISNSYVSLPEGIYIYICIYWCKAKFATNLCFPALNFWTRGRILTMIHRFGPVTSVEGECIRVHGLRSRFEEHHVWFLGKLRNSQPSTGFQRWFGFIFHSHITCHILLLNPKNYAIIEKRAVEILAPNQDLGMKTCQDFQPNCWSALAFSVSKNLNWGPSISPSELQCEAPKIAKLVYNSSNYGLWYL